MRRSRLALGVVGTLAVALGLAAPALGVEIPDHPLRGSITGERIGEGEQFRDACGVAIDSAGDIYVADYYENRIVVFSKKESYLTQIDNVSPLDAGHVAPLDGPCDLAVDSAGNVYANDYHQDVVRFTPATYPPLSHTTYSSALKIDQANSTGVAVDPKTDRVYVNDRSYVAVYEPNGSPVMNGPDPLRIGAASLKDGYGVAISGFPATEGLVYVADAATETVKVYKPSLDPEHPQSEIHGEGTDAGYFYLADTDLAIDPADGHLYVARELKPHFEFTPEEVVDEFSPGGYYRGPVPRSFATGTASFLVAGEPSGLAIGEGNLYVTNGNFEKSSVYIFGPPAPFEAELLTLEKTGAGEGTVTSIPGGIGCDPVCAGEFNKGTTVVLRATPAPGSHLVGWSGCDQVPSANRCAVAMSKARTVGAELGPGGEVTTGSLAAVGPAAEASSAPATPAWHPAAPRHGIPHRRHRHHHRHRRAR